MPGESNFGRLYDALKTDHRIKTDLSREEFISAMEAPGDKGYHNRLDLFNSLKTDGFSQFNTYEEFAAGMGLHAVSKPKANVGNKDTQVRTFAPTKNQSRQQPQQRSQQKQQQSKASKPTAAQNAAMADWAGQAMMDVARGVQRTNKVLDYQSRKAKSPLNVSRVRVGGQKSQTQLLQNNNVVEGDHKINSDSGEFEQTYLTSDGGEYTNRYTADMAQNQLDAVDHMIYLEEHPEEYLLQEKSRIENEMRARALELEKEEESNGNILRNLVQGSRPTVYTDNVRYSDQKYTSLMAQMKQVDEALETLRAAKEGKKSDEWIKKVGDYAEQKWGKYNPLTWAAKIGANVNSFLEGSWRGFVRNVGKVGTWDMGFTDALSAGSLFTSAIDNEKGKAQKEQKDLLNVAALSNKVKQENEQYLGRGYKAGEVTATSLPFMIEMMLNPASGMGQAAQRTAMRYCIKRFGAAAVREATKNYIKKFAFKYGARLTGDAVGSAVMAATTGQVHVVADQLRRMTGDIQYTIDSQGNVVYGGRTNAEDNPFKAYAKAFGAQAIENHSEMLGEYFAPVLGKAGSLLNKGLTKATSKNLYARFGVQKIRNFIAEASHSNIGSFITNLEKRAKWNGTIGEYAEEVAGNIENAILVGDNTLDTDENTGVFNLDQNIDTFLGVALMGGFISTVKTAQYAYGGAKREAYNNMNDVSRRIDRAFAGNFNSMQMWGKWRNTLLVGTDEEKKRTLRSVLDNKELPMAARMAVLDYAKAAQRYQGICMAQATKRASRQITATGRVGQSVDDAKEEGYQATNEEKNAIRRDYRSKRKRLLRVFGEEAKSIEGQNDQELTELYGKLVDEKRSLKKCEALYDYMQSKARYYGMIERAQDDIDDAIDESNRAIDSHANQNGMIQKATLNADGRQVFIVSGNVSLTEDGEKIDTNKSDQSLVIVDAQTGKREMIAPSALQSVDEPIDAAKLKQDEEARIRGEKSQQEADVIDGKLAFNVGDEYGILDYNGKTSRVKVLEDKGETVLVDMDGRQVEVSKKQVQQMYDDFMQSQSDAETEQAANENGLPPYGFSDEFDFTDKDENVIHGEIQGINEDGVEIRTDVPYKGQIVQVIPKEDFENMITSLYREGNEVWNKSRKTNNAPTWGVGSNLEINGHEYNVVSIDENGGTVSLQDENGNSIAWTSNDVNKAISDGRASVIEEKNEESKTLTDNQGNPINEDGTLKVEEVKSVDELTDEDFSNPTRNVQLPTLPKNVDAAIGANGKPVVIKKNIFERNSKRHGDLTPEQSRGIIQSALYTPNLYGQNQKSKRPYNWVVINTKDEQGRNRLVLLEVNRNKDNVEIVHWHYIDAHGLEKIKRQAESEDGQLLILPSDKTEEAGALSSPTSDLSSESKGTEQSSGVQAEAQENAPMPMRRVGKGKNAREEEDWLATSPERGHDYIFSESGLDAETANTFVENKLSEAKKNLDKVKKNEPKIGTSIAEYKAAKQEHDARVAEAQKEVDYWNDVKAVHAKRAFEAENPATENSAAPTVDSAHQVDERISQKWNDANKIDGDADEITLPNGESVKGHYVLTESGAASASHQATNGFAETEGFPVDENGQSVNDRDYKRDHEAQEVTRSMASDYDSRALQSPVVVSREGVVLSGNGRTMAGEIAAQNGTDKKYNDYLRTHANKYGFTEGQVNGFEHPRVLFVPDADMPYTSETFAKFNQREQKSQNKTEQAVKMGKVVDDALFGRVMQTIGTYDTLGEFYGDDAATHGVVKELAAAGVIPQTEMAQLFDGGKLSEAGQSMVEGVLIGKVFQANPDAVREITEVKSMRQSVMAALQEIVTNSRLGGGYDLSQELAEAVDLVYKARKAGYKAGMRVSEYAGQGNLFQLEDGATVADYTNAAVMMLSDVLNDGRTTQLKKVMAFYNRQAADAAQGIGDMFVGGVKSKTEIINEVNKALNNGREYNTTATSLADGQGQRNQSSKQSNDVGTSGTDGKPTNDTSAVTAETDVESGATEGEKSSAMGDVVPSGEGDSPLSEKIATASAEVNTEPTEAQKEAGNYKKGHVQVGTFDITIEQPQGSVRKGTDADGKQWESKMNNTYGYIRGAVGVDGDHIDVFLSNDIDGWNGRKVFVVDQYNPDGSFDEHKVMLGFNDADEAKSDYLANYENGWENGRRIDVTAVNLEDFEKWIASSKRKTKPFSEYAEVKKNDTIRMQKVEDDTAMDAEYFAAVERGDMEEAQRIVNEMAKRAGYSVGSDYQGTSAFNGAAPYGNGYFVTKEERKEAWNNEEFEGESTLGDYIDNGVDGGNLEELTNDASYRHADDMRKEAIENVRKAIDSKRKTITMYRSVPSSVKEGKFRNGDWITPSKKYAIDNAEIHGWGKDYRIIEQEVPVDEVWFDGNDIAEWGYGREEDYANDTDFAYKNTKNNRKLLDVITRDNEGNIIPPSKRFNSNVSDERYQKSDKATKPSKEEVTLRDAVIDHMKGSGLDVLGTEDGQRVLDMVNGRDVRLEAARHKSKEAEERDKQLRTQDLATALVTGKSEQQARAERRERERKFKEETKELYDRVLSGNFDDVTLRLIDDYISKVTPNNYYGRPLSKRLPKRALSKMRGGEQAGSVDALFSRICEGAVGANERTRPEAKRRIEEKKKELLKGWAIATGNWHTSVNDFTNATEPFGGGKDSDVYMSDDGNSVIKVSKGKDNLKRFRPDMDNVALFNYVFPGNSYDIVGYGEIDGKFVRFLRQPFVDFTDSTPLSVEERVAYMEHLGFKPMNDEKTAFTNGEIVASDIQGNNIVKDKQGNIRVIDADMRFHTNDVGGKYTYPPVEKDTELNQPIIREHRVYHGSGAEFDAFDHSHMGEGEGLQIHGYGTYVSVAKGQAEGYARKLADDGESSNLYTVEIPDNNGTNYLEEDQTYAPDNALRHRVDAELEKRGLAPLGDESLTGRKLYREVKNRVKSKKAASEIFSDLGLNGVHYFGQTDGECYVIFNEKDAKITDHVRFFRTKNGEAYGFTVGGKIYIDPKIANSETPVHEYAHLWASALKANNPKEWQNVVNLMKGTSVWEEVKKAYPELKTDDEIADEVLATYSGRRGAERLREEAKKISDGEGSVFDKAVSALERVRQAIDKFWKAVADFLHIHYTSTEQVADQVMKDLLNGVDPRKFGDTKNVKEIDNVRYSLKDGSEHLERGKGENGNGDKTLAGVHNITEDKLRKALKLGGLANPSVAVIDTEKQGHSGYGEISLILPSQMVAKRTGRNAGTFFGDAWTPTYPQVERIFGKGGSEREMKDIESVPDVMKRMTRNAIDSFMDGRGTDDLSYLYLMEQGKAPNIVVSEREFPESLHKEVNDVLAGKGSFLDASEEERKAILSIYVREKFGGNMDEYAANLQEKIHKLEAAIAKHPKSTFLKDRQLRVDDMKQKGYDLDALCRFVDDLSRDEKNAGKPLDFATMQKARDYIKENGLQKDFEAWVNNLSNRYNAKEVIFDGFTPSGKRKYVDNNLVNVSRIMKRKGLNGSEGFGASFNNFAATIMQSSGTLKGIKARKQNLTSNHDDVDAFTEKWSEVYNRLADVLNPNSNIDDYDVGYYRLEETALQKNPKEFAKKEYGVELSEEDVQQLKDMVKSIREERPAMYFETKFERPVTLDEFAAAVVPNNLSADVRSGLEKAGIKLYDYDPQVEGDRKRAFGEAVHGDEGVLFREGNVKNPAEMSDDEKSSRGNQLLSAPAVNVESDQIVKTEEMSARKAAEKWWRENIGEPLFYDTEVGQVEINENSIGSSLAHRYGQAKLDAITSLKDGFKNAVYLGTIQDFIRTEKSVQNHYFAYPINYNGKRNYVFCRAMQDNNKNRLYVHEVFVADNIQNEGNTLQTAAQKPHGGIALYKAILSDVLSAAKVGNNFGTLQLSSQEKSMHQAATDLAKQLHVEGDVEVVTTTEGLTGRQAKAKGWYDVKTGKVTIVLPNNKNAADVRETVFHEVVTHKGLRSLVGDENFNTFLDNIYNNAEEKIQQSIDELSQKYEGDKRKATEEYMAGLAEDGEFAKPENQSFFRKVKDFLVDLLRKVGIKLGFKLTDNDLRYILWRSWKNLKSGGRESLFDKAEDVVKQNELGQTDEARSEHGENGIMFRDGDDVEYDKAMARDIYEKRVSRGLFQTQEAIQDSMLGLKEAMNAILKAEGKKMYIEEIPGYENPYLGENRLSSVSQAECTAFAHTLFKPLLECVAEMAPTKSEREQLTDYMMAKHGLERNEVMAKREAQKLFDEYQKKHPQGAKTLQDFEDKCRERDYAGLTALTGTDNVADAETKAKQMVDDYESKKATSRLWWLTNKVNDAILTKTYESGIISKDTYDDIKSMYDYYIPLRGFDEKTGEETYAYLSNRTNGGSGSAIRRANGRRSKADDPFANMQSMAESAIMQGNRNTLVKQKFLNFALNHPSDLVSVSDLWLWHNDATDEWQAIHPGDIQGTEKIKEDDSPAEVERKIRDFETAIEQAAQNDPDHYMKQKDRPDIPYRVVESSDERQHQVIAKRNGIDYVMIINGNPRAAQALNGQTNPDNDVSGAIGALMNVAQAVNRQLSAFYTTRNPDFVVSNFVRDALYANTFTWVKESPNYALRFHKNFARVNPVKLAELLYKFNEGILDKNDELERMFEQFMMNGGETGYTNVRDIEKHKTDINRELKKYSGGMSIRKGLDLLGENFDLLNRSVENCARFAAFVTSRQMGRSLDRSIYDAKEISVNFNKKGSGAKFMGANGQTFLGNSASFVSGLGRSFYVFWNAAIQGTTNFGRQFGRHPVKAIAGAATMFLLGALMAGIGGSGGDGDDGEGNSYYDLPDFVRRSNILFRFPWQKKSWVSIPLPTEYRAIYGMGELMMSLLSGKVHYTAGELATQIAGQFTQILPLDILEGGGLTTMLPSYLKPVVEVMSNKAWTGMPIYKDSPFNKDMPEWTKAYSSANKYIVGFSKVLNEWTGGDNYTKGWADLNPAKIEYMLGSYFGGFFTTVDKLVKMAETALGDREYDPKSMLVVNRLIKQGDERTEFRAINNEYFRIKEESEKLETRLRNYERDTASGVFNYAEKIHQLNNAPGYQILEAYKNAEMDLNNIDTELSNQSLTNEERVQLEELQNIRKKELVEQVNDIRKGKKYTPKSTSEGQVQEMLSVYNKFKKKINEINKLKDTNLDEYSRQWQILTSDPNYIVYVIANDYKSDISALTKKFANSKTQKERKAAADSMISTRNRYLELLNDAKQGK